MSRIEIGTLFAVSVNRFSGSKTGFAPAGYRPLAVLLHRVKTYPFG
jgi:hypothetical protein